MTYLQESCEDALCQQFKRFENIGVLVQVAITTHELGSKKYQDTMITLLAANWIKVRESKYYQFSHRITISEHKRNTQALRCSTELKESDTETIFHHMVASLILKITCFM